MKKNRSNIFTVGVTCIANKEKNLRYPLFELDKSERYDKNGNDNLLKIFNAYEKFSYSFVTHRTGNGWHFLSPNVITIQEWKIFMDELHNINTTCPMITLRIKSNKYLNEKNIWMKQLQTHDTPYLKERSRAMCSYLNELFFCGFTGTHIDSTVKTVQYPLPFVDEGFDIEWH